MTIPPQLLLYLAGIALGAVFGFIMGFIFAAHAFGRAFTCGKLDDWLREGGWVRK